MRGNEGQKIKKVTRLKFRKAEEGSTVIHPAGFGFRDDLGLLLLVEVGDLAIVAVEIGAGAVVVGGVGPDDLRL